jgi:hypothetical protein
MNGNDSFFDELREQQSGAVSNEGAVSPVAEQYAGSTPDSLAVASPATTPNHEGGLTGEAKRALVSLLRHGVILATQKPRLFESIIRYQNAVRRHLSDVYLKLVLDEKSGVIFVASISEEDCQDDVDDADEIVSLITRRTLSLYDTLLLLVLRKHYQERESTGEQKVVIDLERMESNLRPFLALTNNSKNDRQKLTGSLKKMQDKKIVSQVRGSQDRFEITPVIRYVVNAEFLESMLTEYQQLAKQAGLALSEKLPLESDSVEQVKQ